MNHIDWNSKIKSNFFTFFCFVYSSNEYVGCTEYVENKNETLEEDY